ncbi:hypothetical protein A500_06066 [Clostridium sartagoforme AAU1]|uniref:Uncharacterized protein n=1 Tax=Clostridium sartagoforme AAU1 TaxID=1202534 RepID=R9CCI0_9CLOT|nr:hypothetical protein [Clostridium sartagoforme]EOR27084.1 hypothetical protein A500_06066 [Clostridium sartagoforme AAU1]
MYTIGEFNNSTNINSRKNSAELEQYCKDEGLNSTELRRDANKSSEGGRNSIIENISTLIKKII